MKDCFKKHKGRQGWPLKYIGIRWLRTVHDYIDVDHNHEDTIIHIPVDYMCIGVVNHDRLFNTVCFQHMMTIISGHTVGVRDRDQLGGSWLAI